MSDRPDLILLLDIKFAIEKINSYIVDIDYNEFSKNELIRDAVERNIEIIGEACSKISIAFQQKFNSIEWHKPISMRNRLMQGYFSVDIPMLWNTITKILPEFYVQINPVQKSI